jgi:hypothetical protein
MTIKGHVNDVPITYMSNNKAWATQKLSADWFHNRFVPEVEEHEMYELKHEPDNVRASLLLDNAPAHPSADLLRLKNGKIKCLFLTTYTSSLIQPMDQGVILTYKRLYRNKQLDECHVFMVENEGIFDDIGEDNRGQKTLIRLKECNIKV